MQKYNKHKKKTVLQKTAIVIENRIVVSRERVPTESSELFLFLIALGVPLFLCASQLNRDIWYDEAFTLIHFVSHGFKTIVTDYSYPNNHVLYSIILFPFYKMSDSEFVLRLPSLLFSIGTLFCTYSILRRMVSPSAGAIGMLWLGLTQLFLNFTMQLRGYGCSMFLAMMLFSFSIHDKERLSLKYRMGMILLMASFLYILPTNIFFYIPIAITSVIFSMKNDCRLRAILTDISQWACGSILAFLCYLPILSQLLSQKAAKGEWMETWYFSNRFLWVATLDARWFWYLCPFGLILWFFRVRKEQAEVSFVWPISLFFLVVGPFVLLGVSRIGGIFIRNFTPVIPFLALIVGWLLWEIIEAVRKWLQPALPRWSTTMAGMVILWIVLLPKLVSYPERLSEYREDPSAQDKYYEGYYDYYSANFHPSQVVGYLKTLIPPEQNYIIASDRQGYNTIPYYLKRANVPPFRLVFDSAGEVQGYLYTIVPKLANYSDISQNVGLSQDRLKQFPLVKDFGYYKLYRSALPIHIRR